MKSFWIHLDCKQWFQWIKKKVEKWETERRDAEKMKCMERDGAERAYSVADVALWSGSSRVERDGGKQSLDPGPVHTGPAGPQGHKLQPNWRILWRPHCYRAEDGGGDWGGGPFLSLSFQPGSFIGWNNIGLGVRLRRALLHRVHLRLTFAMYK